MWKESVAHFTLNSIEQLLKMSKEINDGTYKSNETYSFIITRHKPREIETQTPLVSDFKQYEMKKDENNPFSNLYFLETGESFYVEPVFYTQMKGFKEQFADQYDLIVEQMIKMVKAKKKVVFTGNFENPLTEVDGYCYLEITDVTDPLQIFAEDKSRGSDYGD